MGQRKAVGCYLIYGGAYGDPVCKNHKLSPQSMLCEKAVERLIKNRKPPAQKKAR